MVWGAFITSIKSYLVLHPHNKHIVVNFVILACKVALEHLYYHLDNNEPFILMEDGTPMHY
jgi:hypothetical protein